MDVSSGGCKQGLKFGPSSLEPWALDVLDPALDVA